MEEINENYRNHTENAVGKREEEGLRENKRKKEKEGVYIHL